jgi:UDPglucose 6-dehydrogenase
MRIAIVGQGYVGVTASACLADAGHEVIGVEADPARLGLLRDGHAPLYEPGLEELLRDVIAARRLVFCSSLREIDAALDAVIVAVGTPPLPSGGADLREVGAVLRDVATLNPAPGLVMMKSTIPPGTSERLLAEASPAMCLRDRYVVSPEFLALGSSLKDWRQPSRVVVGMHNRALVPTLEDLYAGIEAPWVLSTPTTAETIKYASNAFLATKVSFINEIANLCDLVGATIDEVAQGMSLDPRIGSAYLRAGVGYGGSCFPKDTQALAHISSFEGHSLALVGAAIAVNNAQRLRVVRTVRDLITEPRAVVAVLGLSFKPGTDDLRDAPSLTVVAELVARGYRVRIWDPVVDRRAAEQGFPGANVTHHLEDAVAGCSAVVVLTEWPQVVDAPWPELVEHMHPPRLVVDGRNCLDPDAILLNGGCYRGIGRPASKAPRREPVGRHS